MKLGEQFHRLAIAKLGKLTAGEAPGETRPFHASTVVIELHLEQRSYSKALEAVLAEQGREIGLVWLSGVHYYTGTAPDLERITRLARDAGCLVGFDLAHAAGNVELRLHDWDVDVAVWCSYKYLNAGPGAVGGCYLHERHARNAALPRFGGWWGNDPSTRFAMQSHPRFVPVPSADGWQLSNPPILSLAPLRASLDLFDRAGLSALREKSVRLTGYLEYLLDRLGGPLEIITTRDPARRGCQLSLRIRDRDGAALSRALAEGGFVTDFRDPEVVRVAPVPLYNTYHEVWRFVRAMDELLRPR